MSLTLNQIRKRYLEYMRDNSHVILKSSSLVPENDPTTLFTGSGMQPMINYLLGEQHPSGKRLTDSQKCFRSQDIEEVGDNRHTTFFEMLGNWSLGDYFKKEQIALIYKFLTDDNIGLGIDKNRLYFSCYEGNLDLNIERDEESKKYWLDLGVSEGHIFFYGDKKNWWSRSGIPKNMPIGELGGPDTEIFFDFDPILKTDNNNNVIHGFDLHKKAVNKDDICNPNCDCGRFMEIGNSVFMQFKKDILLNTQNVMVELSQKNVDFGGGLERLAAAARGDADIFNLDVFDNPKTILEKLSNQKYISDVSVTFTNTNNKTFAYRVILDHIRAATFLIGDGVFPGNKEQQYFVRRLIRRAVKYAKNIDINTNFTRDLALSFIEYYSQEGEFLGENLNKNKDIILSEIDKEETKFRKTLEIGLKKLNQMIINSNMNNNNSSCGMGNPLQIISGEKLFDLYQQEGFPFELSIEIIKDVIQKNSSLLQDYSNYFGESFWDQIQIDFLEHKKQHADKSRTSSEGMFKGGLADTEEITTALHSITHIMLAGMKKVLGDSVHQAGSNINSERLRFDFTFDKKLEDIEIIKIEEYVNNAIREGFITVTEEMPKQKAKDEGVEGSFWEKYPDTVKVWTIKNNLTGQVYSKELCGGPHVISSQDYLFNKTFKIIKQEAISIGVRRVKGILI